MGNFKSCLECFDNPDYLISIKTGDTKGAGLHNTAEIILINDRGEESRKIQLSGCCVTVFKKGRTDSFAVKNLPDFGEIIQVKIEQHSDQNDVEWFIEKIVVTQITGECKEAVVFPVQRWLRMNKSLAISRFDCCLPQNELNRQQRIAELNLKRMIYGYRKSSKDLPPQMKHIPRDEVFSNFYKWDVTQKRACMFSVYHIPDYEKPESWRNFEEIESLFRDKGKFRRPLVLDQDWTSDKHFGKQRLRGCNPKSIKLCKSIPENFAVTDEMVSDNLGGLTLCEAMEQNRLFIVDHSILDGIYGAESHQIIPSPMALFYLNESDDLMPIAIQLFQEPSSSNPVFLPDDPCYTWLLAKMWFNNADAAFQRACLLCTSSHWIMENICLSVHRRLSPSHPIFRLLAPYLRLVLAINHFEMHPLIQPGGWADQNTTLKSDGMHQLIKKYWSNFNFSRDCCLKEEMKQNEVFSAEILSEYPYRDDGVLLYNCINNFMRQMVLSYYQTEEDLLKDAEIQGWASELVSKDSCNFDCVPGDGQFTNHEDLVHVLTCVVYKSTVEHAALNLPLYDECAFVPNYPLFMRGEPPQTKDPLTEADIMAALPTKHVTMEIIIISKISSERDSSGLADSRAQYQYDCTSKPARDKFLFELREAAAVISIRNKNRKIFYDYLNPASAKSQLVS